jgi:hypothetical protein
MSWPPFSQTIASSNWPFIRFLSVASQTRAVHLLWFLVAQPAILAHQISHATHFTKSIMQHIATAGSRDLHFQCGVWKVACSMIWPVFLTHLSVPAIILQIQHLRSTINFSECCSVHQPCCTCASVSLSVAQSLRLTAAPHTFWDVQPWSSKLHTCISSR